MTENSSRHCLWHKWKIVYGLLPYCAVRLFKPVPFFPQVVFKYGNVVSTVTVCPVPESGYIKLQRKRWSTNQANTLSSFGILSTTTTMVVLFLNEKTNSAKSICWFFLSEDEMRCGVCVLKCTYMAGEASYRNTALLQHCISFRSSYFQKALFVMGFPKHASWVSIIMSTDSCQQGLISALMILRGMPFHNIVNGAMKICHHLVIIKCHCHVQRFK